MRVRDKTGAEIGEIWDRSRDNIAFVRARSVKNIAILRAWYLHIGKEQTGVIRPDGKIGTALKDPGNGKLMHPLPSPKFSFFHCYNFIDDDS